MDKKIHNVFDYSNYLVLLSDDFMARSANNYGYSLRAYSRDLSLSPGFLSDLLRGNKDLSPAKGREVFSKLQFSNDEVDYIEKLIVFKSSPDESQRQDALQYIQSKFNKLNIKNDNSKDLILKSHVHFLLYGIIRRVHNKETIFNLTDNLSLDRNEVEKALNEYVLDNYIIEKDGQYQVNDIKLTINNHKNLYQTIGDLSVQINQALQKKAETNSPENMAHGLVLGLNQQSFDLAAEAHKHFIKSLYRIADHQAPVDRFVFVSNSWLTVKTN